MSDYHSPNERVGRRSLDYDTGGSYGWLWAGVVLVALLILFALLGSGGGDGSVAPTIGAEGATSLDAPAAETTAPAIADDTVAPPATE